MHKIIDYINKNLDIHEVYYEIFGKRIPSGKLYCPCPTHNNVNTPAAKCYGNSIHCFSCNKTYGVYDLLKWYNPEKINEIKQTQIITTQQEELPRKFIIKKIDRTRSIDDILSDILS